MLPDWFSTYTAAAFHVEWVLTFIHRRDQWIPIANTARTISSSTCSDAQHYQHSQSGEHSRLISNIIYISPEFLFYEYGPATAKYPPASKHLSSAITGTMDKRKLERSTWKPSRVKAPRRQRARIAESQWHDLCLPRMAGFIPEVQLRENKTNKQGMIISKCAPFNLVN